jgi:short-subunit dehydrogenase
MASTKFSSGATDGMDFPIKGGVAVITGAASGIGAALAANLAGRGMNLALADRNEVGLAATAQKARAAGVTVSEHMLDVTDVESVAAFPEDVLRVHGKVTLLVNNAGVALLGTFDQVTQDDFAWVMDVNFWGPVRLTRAFLYALHREPAAHIVNISSIFGIIAPPGNAAYCASKFAVRGFSESLRHELIGSNLTLTVVHPGGIRTAIADNARVSQGIDPADAATGKLEFNKLLKTSPEEAAEQIARAVVKRRGRLLIGRDARMLDIIQRIFPMTYWKQISRGQSNIASRAALSGR